MGNWTTISNSSSGSAPTVPNAPNIVSVTPLPGQSSILQYDEWGNLSAYIFSCLINLPTSNTDYIAGHLKKIHVIWSQASAWSSTITYNVGDEVLYSGTTYVSLQASNTNQLPSSSPSYWQAGPSQPEEVDVLYGPWSSSPITYTSEPILQDDVALTGTLSFLTENDDGVVTRTTDSDGHTPVTVNLSVQASAVNSVSATYSVADNTYDPATRQVHAHPKFVPVMNANQMHQVFGYWLSMDNGATFGFYGCPTIDTVGQAFPADTIAPTVAQQWQFACQAGWFSYSSSVPVKKSDLLLMAPNCVFSNILSIPALTLPSATDITNITIPAGTYTDPNFPYNVVATDGTQQWDIPPFTIDDTTAASDGNAYVAQTTIQNLDSTHTPLAGVAGVEKLFSGFQVSKTGATYTSGQLGPFSYLNAIAYIRYRVYVINRAEQVANTGWTQLATVGRLQIGGGGNLNAGYVDVMIAAAGAVPPAQFTPKNMALNSFGKGLYVDPSSGQVGSGNSGNPLNMLADPLFDQGTNGMTGWITNYGSWTVATESGTLALHCAALSPESPTDGTTYIMQAFDTKPGKCYYIHSLYRVTSLGGSTPVQAALAVYYFDKNGTWLTASSEYQIITATPGWQQTISYTSNGAPAGAVEVQFLFGGYNIPAGQVIEYDSPSVIEQTATGSGTQPSGTGGVVAKYSAAGGVTVDVNGNMVVNQAALAITNFTGNLDVSRVGNLAAIAIASFYGNLDVSRVGNLASFSITNFSGNLDISRVNNITSINIGTLAGTLNVTYQVADGSIPINKIATLYVNNINGWDGAAITVNTGMQFSGGPGIVRICDSLHGANVGLYVSTNIRCDGTYYSGTTAGRTASVTVGTIQLNFLNGLYTGFSNVG